MRVITFSRFFPTTHPRRGEPTNFVEKIWEGLSQHTKLGFDFSILPVEFNSINENDFAPKFHTIRAVKPHLKAGFRWDVGDWFSPRVWAGKPYCSKQIEFSPPIQIKKVWDIEIEGYCIWVNKKTKNQFKFGTFAFELAKNDGLKLSDFWDWFPYKKGKRFSGQILCWNEKIEYS